MISKSLWFFEEICFILNIMENVSQYDLVPLGTAALSFAGYIGYMKQFCPEEEEDYVTGGKIAFGIALLTYIVQQGLKHSDGVTGETEVVLEGPFIKKE